MAENVCDCVTVGDIVPVFTGVIVGVSVKVPVSVIVGVTEEVGV